MVENRKQELNLYIVPRGTVIISKDVVPRGTTSFDIIIQNSRFKIQNDTTERYIEYLSVVVFENYGSNGNNGSLGRLRSLGNLGKTIFNTLLVIIGFSGLGDTLVEGTNKREIWGCRIYSSRTYLSFICSCCKATPKSAN